MNLEVAGNLYPDPTLEPYAKSGTELPPISDALLGLASKREPYFLILAGVGIYAAALVAVLTIKLESPPLTLEAPVEVVYEDPVPDEPEQPPVPPEPEVAPEPPPEPTAEAEKVAEPEPVKEVTPPKPVQPPQPEKPQPKPKPKAATAQTPGAVPSDYANKVYQRINRVAGSGFPRSALSRGQSLRIGYVIVIGSGGELISKTVSRSGNAALDQAVSDALARSAPFPTPPALGAKSYRLSGAIVYRLQ